MYVVVASRALSFHRGYRLILMTQTEASPPVPEEKRPSRRRERRGRDGDRADADAESQPEPIPWTPERFSEWNAYYDIYVMLAVLLLAFVVSAVRVDENNPLLWTHLKTGELTAQQGYPVVSDSFSYSETGARDGSTFPGSSSGAMRRSSSWCGI